METLFEEAFAGFTWLQVGLVTLGLLMILSLLRAMGAKKRAGAGRHQEVRSCGNCDWRGHVSKFHRVCPKCAGKLG